MTSIEPIRTQRHNNGISDLLMADVVGASAALGADYWLQKDAFKNADRYIPILKKQVTTLTQNNLDASSPQNIINYLKDKKINNYSLFDSALKGAAVTGLLLLGYHWIKNTAGKNDRDFGEKTATAASIGAIGAGLASYFSQKSIMNSLCSIRDSVQTYFVTQLSANKISKKGLKLLTQLSSEFENLSTAIGNGKVLKSVIAHSALRGAAYTGAAYVLFRGIKALFNRKPRPQINIVAIPDEMAKTISRTDDIIDV